MNEEAGKIDAGSEGGDDTNVSVPDPAERQALESKARQMGWAPKTEWRGPGERWIDAPDFIRRGEELLPIVNAQNRSLRDQLAQTQVQLREAAEAIEALKEFNSKSNREELTRSREELAVKIKQARDDGDTKAELELTEKFTEAGDALREAKTSKAKVSPAAATTSTVPAEFQQWAGENPWFEKDEAKTDFALGVSQRIRLSQPSLQGRAFLDEVARRVNAQFDPPRRTAASKVEGAQGGNGSPQGGGDQGKGYSDLPADAKAACDKDAKRLVGPTRAFKTVADWQKQYTKVYFAS